jgi:hypothetical protein
MDIKICLIKFSEEDGTSVLDARHDNVRDVVHLDNAHDVVQYSLAILLQNDINIYCLSSL